MDWRPTGSGGMQRSVLRQKRSWFTLGFSALCLLLFVREVDWPSLYHETRELLSSPRTMLLLVMPSIALTLFCMVLRAWRWQSLLGEPRIPSKRLFIYLSIGFMCNITLPARAGEFIRTYLASARESRRLPSVLATVIVERVFDFAMILLFLGSILVFVPFPEGANSVGDERIRQLETLGMGSFGLVGGVTAFLVLLVYFPVWVGRLVERMLKSAPKGLAEKIGDLLRAFTDGLSTFKRPRSAILAILLSLALWLLTGYSEYLIILAFGIEGVPFSATLVIMVAICIFVALPQAPGGLGVSQLACFLVMTEVYAVPEGVAGAFALMLWATQIIPLIIMGVVCLGYAGLNRRWLFSLDPTSEQSCDNKRT